MDNEKILDSGFVKAFIEEYYNDKNFYFYPDRDRLNYTLCNNHEEKQEYTTEQLIETKNIIKNLGFEELSFAHIVSNKPNSPNFIEPHENFDFWLNRYASHYRESNDSFTPIKDNVLWYFKKKELDDECFENEEDFWEFYPNYLCPEMEILPLIIIEENKILSQIEFEIDEYIINETWEFDYDKYQKSRAYIKPIDDLLNLCELLVQLNRLKMLQEFLEIKEDIPKIHNKSLKTFINKINTQDYSLSEALKEIKSNYPDEQLLRIYTVEFINEVKGIFLDLLLSLTDNDILEVLKFHNSLIEEPITTISLNKNEYSYVKSFVREIEGYNVISNVDGFEYDKSKEFQLISLDQIFRQNLNYSVISNLSIIEEYQKLIFLWEIEKELKAYLIPNNNPESKKSTNNQPILSKKQEGLSLLKKIWLPEPRISIESVLKSGIEKGIWTEDYTIQVQKGSLYGTGKTLLGSLAIALKGYAIGENTDYKMVGKAFCTFFNIPVKETTQNPYKAFSSRNEKFIREFKRQFSLR